MDRHDAELALTGFHPDARDDHGLFIGSAQDMIKWAEDTHRKMFRGHQHQLMNMSVDINGDEAHAETYVTLLAVIAGTWRVISGGGRYVDRLERRNDKWGIVDRVSIVEWWSDDATMEKMSALIHPYSQDSTDISYQRPLRAIREPRDLTAFVFT
jgi:hypothetical protein